MVPGSQYKYGAPSTHPAAAAPRRHTINFQPTDICNYGTVSQATPGPSKNFPRRPPSSSTAAEEFMFLWLCFIVFASETDKGIVLSRRLLLSSCVWVVNYSRSSCLQEKGNRVSEYVIGRHVDYWVGPRIGSCLPAKTHNSVWRTRGNKLISLICG